MADNEYNDEYQFDEFDAVETESPGEQKSGSTGATGSKPLKPRSEGGSNVKRNALIVVVLVGLLMLGYKFFGSFFSGKEKPAEIPSISTTTETPPSQSPVSTVQPVQEQVPPPPVEAKNTAPVVQPSVDNSEINQKFSSLDLSQQNLHSDISAISSKLNGINANINQLNEKIANHSQMLTALASKLEQQSTEIAVLIERTKPKVVRRLVVKGRSGPLYSVQAIIPGRAWLIATNGSTITVREGTQVPGYGVVKLIDPNQGRVVTSSGQVIRFSQQDS